MYRIIVFTVTSVIDPMAILLLYLYYSGGVMLAIDGTALRSVADPMMRVKIAYSVDSIHNFTWTNWTVGFIVTCGFYVMLRVVKNYVKIFYGYISDFQNPLQTSVHAKCSKKINF